MNEERSHFALRCSDGMVAAPVLTGVQVRGRLDAVVFDLTLRQSYRNAGDQVLEVVYTFPLPPMAVLLGFASELNGVRQAGEIVAKAQAERQYEAALVEGDAPVMLEAHGDGLHTANIGNLQPGDEIVLECRFAQLLSFEQGRLRVAIPTTIAPRYGRPDLAGLQPQQVPQASLDADYPLALTLTIGEALAGATAACPTHRFSLHRDESGLVCLELDPDARLDRDVVVTVTPREPRPSLLVRSDNAFDPSVPVVVMAALQPPVGAPRDHIALKLLLDCSGSMNGDSMHSARAALRGVVAGLTEHDSVSLSRFGSTTQHLFALSPAKPQVLRHLQALVDGLDADLGGTEVAAALDGVIGLAGMADASGADVLLITDGAVWDTGNMVANARRSGHRVFAIGVGSAPAEGALRALAEATGGACEFATPGEALEAAAHRMLQRMRQPAFTNVRVDWGSPPAWSSGPAHSVFGGDTVIAFAGFTQPTPAGAIRLLADGADGQTVELARVEADAPCPGDSLPRIAAAHRVAQEPDTNHLALALQYQLMSKRTNCVLVHERADADKVGLLASMQSPLHRIAPMFAAGSHGLGSVGACLSGLAGPITAAFATNGARSRLRDLATGRVAFGGRRSGGSVGTAQRAATQEAMARSVQTHLAEGGHIQGLRTNSKRMRLHMTAVLALAEVAGLGLSLAQAWLLLAHWVNDRANGLADAELAQLLQPLVDAIDATLAAAACEAFERTLGPYPVGEWNLSAEAAHSNDLGPVGS